MEKLNADDASCAGVSKSDVATESMFAVGIYTATCYDKDGNVKWSDTYKNLVVNVGKADILQQYFSGSTYTAAWYLGLVDGASAPTYNAADTMASHAGWTENVGYSAATRPAPSWSAATGTGGGSGTAGTGSKSTTATAFSINATSTIAGTFLVTNNTKSGTTGTLYSAGSFTGGNRSVASGDTLNVTYTAQV